MSNVEHIQSSVEIARVDLSTPAVGRIAVRAADVLASGLTDALRKVPITQVGRDTTAAAQHAQEILGGADRGLQRLTEIESDNPLVIEAVVGATVMHENAKDLVDITSAMDAKAEIIREALALAIEAGFELEHLAAQAAELQSAVAAGQEQATQHAAAYRDAVV